MAPRSPGWCVTILCRHAYRSIVDPHDHTTGSRVAHRQPGHPAAAPAGVDAARRPHRDSCRSNSGGAYHGRGRLSEHMFRVRVCAWLTHSRLCPWTLTWPPAAAADSIAGRGPRSACSGGRRRFHLCGRAEARSGRAPAASAAGQARGLNAHINGLRVRSICGKWPLRVRAAGRCTARPSRCRGSSAMFNPKALSLHMLPSPLSSVRPRSKAPQQQIPVRLLQPALPQLGSW
jgi:hypothetical protein